MIASLVPLVVLIPVYALVMLTLVAGTVVFWRRSR